MWYYTQYVVIMINYTSVLNLFLHYRHMFHAMNFLLKLKYIDVLV